MGVSQYLLFLCVLTIFKNVYMDSSDCESYENCKSCIRQHDCTWCINPVNLGGNTSAARCQSSLNAYKFCRDANVINPQASEKILEEIPLETAKGKDAVLISPQKVKLQLRRGEEYKFKFKYAQAEDYPVDLYYIMDLSASMEPHRETLSSLGNVLARTMKNLTRKFQLGFGSFVDKVILPYTNTHPAALKMPCKVKINNKERPCAAPYAFRNHLSLTEDTDIFSIEVGNAKVSGNLDAPEGGLDALMQAIVCKDVIKWRPKARHLLVFSTDESFHIAGDGKLAGIVEPNDGLCHMDNNEYTHSLEQDYPSIGFINEKAIEHHVNIIFAVDSEMELLYKDLAASIKEANYGILSKKSDNVVKLIEDVYNKIVDSVKITDNFDSDRNIDIKYYSDCNKKPNEETRECHNLHVGMRVDFTAAITLLNCPSDGNYTRTFQIKPAALDESITVEIEMICDCPCEKHGNPGFEIHPKQCSGSGNLTCGICTCPADKFGAECECDGTSSRSITDDTNCRSNQTGLVCSGQGSCLCGQCQCNKRDDTKEVISGKYCECNNYSCFRTTLGLCSGESHGTCVCKKCSCHAGWTGESCECSTRTETCQADPNNNTLCSDNGKCICGRCECESKNGHRFSGKYCEDCVTCESYQSKKCDKFHDCAKCYLLESETDCSFICQGYDVKTVDKIETYDNETYKCERPINDCNFIYTYSANGSYITVQMEKICSEPTDVLPLVFGVIGSILLAGLILLIMWKVLTTIHDRREFAKFENERMNARWHRGENPLFKKPTTQFNNPMYSK